MRDLFYVCVHHDQEVTCVCTAGPDALEMHRLSAMPTVHSYSGFLACL